jgi:hypothetical protein
MIKGKMMESVDKIKNLTIGVVIQPIPESTKGHHKDEEVKSESIAEKINRLEKLIDDMNKKLVEKL